MKARLKKNYETEESEKRMRNKFEEFEKERNEELVVKTKKETRTMILTLVLVTCLILVVVSIAVIQNIINPLMTYNSASDLFNEGKFEEAKAIFVKLKDYNNSVEMVKECDLEVLYLDAKQNVIWENLELAITKFEKLGEYKDAKLLPANSFPYLLAN